MILQSGLKAASAYRTLSPYRLVYTRSVHPYVCHQVTDVQQVPVPLCKRAATYVEQLAVLMQWRQNVLHRIKDVKDAFEAADGGPGASELQVFHTPLQCLYSGLTARWL